MLRFDWLTSLDTIWVYFPLEELAGLKSMWVCDVMILHYMGTVTVNSNVRLLTQFLSNLHTEVPCRV